VIKREKLMRDRKSFAHRGATSSRAKQSKSINRKKVRTKEKTSKVKRQKDIVAEGRNGNLLGPDVPNEMGIGHPSE